jgi:hypothetical protein
MTMAMAMTEQRMIGSINQPPERTISNTNNSPQKVGALYHIPLGACAVEALEPRASRFEDIFTTFRGA